MSNDPIREALRLAMNFVGVGGINASERKILEDALATPAAEPGAAIEADRSARAAAQERPAFYCAFAENTALPDYSGGMEADVARKVLEKAWHEGYRGTAEARLKELDWQIRPVYATPPVQSAAAVPEPDHEFTDWSRAALLWVLWHHQDASSPEGQPIRFALGMGAFDRLTADQIAEAKRWAELTPHFIGTARGAPPAAPEASSQGEAVAYADAEGRVLDRRQWLNARDHNGLPGKKIAEQYSIALVPVAPTVLPAQEVAEPAIGFSPMHLAPIDGTPVLLYMPTCGDKFAVGQFHADNGDSICGHWGDDEGHYYQHEPVGFMSLRVLERLAASPSTRGSASVAGSAAPADAGELAEKLTPVPGAIWYEGSVSLIRRGAEDGYCESHPGASRIYFGIGTKEQAK